MPRALLRTTIIRRIFLGVCILVAEFGVLEAGLRVVGAGEAAPEFRSLFMQDPRIGYRLQPGARVTYSTIEFSTDIAINGQGVRDDEDIGPKAPGERRVVVLGDSLVLAVQVPLAQTFCKLLEAKLNASDHAHRWRVIDAGVQGYGPVDEWLFFRHVAEAFEPDLVLVVSFVGNAVVANDKEAWLDAGGPTASAIHETVLTAARRVVRSSMVLQIAQLRYTQLKTRLRGPVTERPLTPFLADPPPDARHGFEVTRRAFGMIARRAAEHGANTAVILAPARFQLNDEDFANLAEAVRQAGGTLVRNSGTERSREALAPLGLPMLDLLPALQAQPDPSGLFFQRNVHFTPRGHQVVAEAIFHFLQTNDLLR